MDHQVSSKHSNNDIQGSPVGYSLQFMLSIWNGVSARFIDIFKAECSIMVNSTKQWYLSSTIVSLFQRLDMFEASNCHNNFYENMLENKINLLIILHINDRSPIHSHEVVFISHQCVTTCSQLGIRSQWCMTFWRHSECHVNDTIIPKYKRIQ